MDRHALHCSVFAALVLFAPSLSFSQSTAFLTGTVLAPSGAVVPEARATCRNVETDLKAPATTKAAGLFRFPGLPVGLYELMIAKEGFGSMVTEAWKAEVRWETFNALSHTNFDLMHSTGSYSASQHLGPAFGKVVHARDPRLMQLALKLRF